ncbi:unnamed protein product [Prorocentrum cordatum]|uniref:Uncharacterized protein n=1 Tax=Prorocentrum cordatum TaxID=2364126 RepID=A0ABN9VLU4_9DINO|nr:unnamed protein product [Polarella glacialis]
MHSIERGVALKASCNFQGGGPSVLINAHPACMQLPQDCPIVIAQGDKDEVYAVQRETAEALISTGSQDKTFLLWIGSSGLLPQAGQDPRRPARCPTRLPDEDDSSSSSGSSSSDGEGDRQGRVDRLASASRTGVLLEVMLPRQQERKPVLKSALTEDWEGTEDQFTPQTVLLHVYDLDEYQEANQLLSFAVDEPFGTLPAAGICGHVESAMSSATEKCRANSAAKNRRKQDRMDGRLREFAAIGRPQGIGNRLKKQPPTCAKNNEGAEILD